MANRLMRPGLASPMGMDTAKFFALVDATGGWPVGYQYAGFVHSDEREAGFCNSSNNDGWWTVIATADDYYLWKITPTGLQRLVDAVIGSMRLPRLDAQHIRFESWRGSRAPIQPLKETGHG